MKLRLGFIVVIVCIIGVALFKTYPGDSVLPLQRQTIPATPQAPSSSVATPVKNALALDDDIRQSDNAPVFMPITGGKPRVRAPIDPFKDIPKRRHGLSVKEEFNVAESIEEARWLDRNGYPNNEQMRAYSAAPDIVLEQAAAYGDSVAAVMLAGRQLSKGDLDAAGKLMTAGMNGSSYALSTLGSHLATSKDNGNPELGYTILRVVELRGDWRAGLTREFLFGTNLSQEQRIRAEGEAIVMLNTLRKNSTIRPYVDPRPLMPLTQD